MKYYKIIAGCESLHVSSMAEASGANGTAHDADEIAKSYVALSDNADTQSEVLFSEKEIEIVECYDRLEELRLQCEILEAQTDDSGGQ